MNKKDQEPKKYTNTDIGSKWIYVTVIGLNIIYILLFYWINQSYGNL